MQAKSHQRGNTAVLAVVAGALGVVGFLAAVSLAHGASRSNATVSLRKTSLGMVLVGANGHTLYLFGKDRGGKSACTASCAKFWPPLLTKAKPTAGTGVSARLLGTTKRSNGSMQVTYNSHPLYTYTLDKSAGQTKGEGVDFFGAKWFALSAKGVAVVKAAPASTTPAPAPPPYSNPTPYP